MSEQPQIYPSLAGRDYVLPPVLPAICQIPGDPQLSEALVIEQPIVRLFPHEYVQGIYRGYGGYISFRSRQNEAFDNTIMATYLARFCVGRLRASLFYLDTVTENINLFTLPVLFEFLLMHYGSLRYLGDAQVCDIVNLSKSLPAAFNRRVFKDTPMQAYHGFIEYRVMELVKRWLH